MQLSLSLDSPTFMIYVFVKRFTVDANEPLLLTREGLMIKRFTDCVLAVFVSVLCVAAGSIAAAKSPIKAIMIALPAGDDFYYTIENAAREQAKASDVSLTVQQLPSYDITAEISVLDAAIASRPDVLLVSALDPNGLQSTLEQAKQMGIKIILYDGGTRDISVAETFVSADIVELGRNAAREFTELAGSRKGSVFYQGTQAANVFFDALHSGWAEILDKSPNYKQLPINYSDFEPAKAASEMQGVLVGTPDLIGGFAGVFLDQQGNIPAVEQAGKRKDLVLIAVDGAPQNVERLRKGRLDALVSVRAEDYGKEAIKAAVAAMNGQKLPQRTIIGQCLLTAANLDDPDNAPCLYQLYKK